MTRRLSAALTVCVAAWSVPAAAQIAAQPSLLPATGTNAQLGNEFQAFQRSFEAGTPPPPTPGTPSLLIRPSIGLQEEYTDNALATSGGGKSSDLITILQPGLVITDESQRLKVNLNYTPNIYFYARNSSQNRISENFSGTALATVVPDLLFIDLRGFAAEQAISGGLAQTGAVTLSRQNTSQDYSFSLSPYLLHRFGSWGTGELGYAIGRTIQNDQGTVSLPLTTGFVNQNVTTQNEHVGFTSGENFGRVSNATLLTATQYDGAGVLSAAHRNIFTLDNGYALTRNIVLLGKVGYEDIHYSGTTQINIRDEIWNAGIRLTPNADSSITVRYGHQDGLNSLLVDASYAPTARSRLFARYSSGLTTGAEELQNALATSSVDGYGNTVDSQTGAPLLLASNFFGVQNNLYKQRLLSVTGVLQFARDAISATVSNQDQTLLSAASATAVGTGSSNGTYGTLSWSRDINPRLSSSLSVQYGTQTTEAPQQSEQKLLAGGASLRYIFTETLFGTLQYSFNRTRGNISLGSMSEDIVYLSLQKTF